MGESTDSGNDAGSDVPDRSNPNEMAARERAAARAGTVTGGGSPVTSTNADGTKSVVTTGTDFERSMAQQDFAREQATRDRVARMNELALQGVVGANADEIVRREISDGVLSRSAASLAAEVARKEQAALERAAAAGRLAGAPRIGQPPAALGLDDELAFTQGMSGGAPRIGDITQAAGTGFTDPETARIANLTPDQAAAENITVSRQRAAQAAMQGRTVNPVTGALQGPDLINIFSEAGLDPAAGQEAQRQRNAEAQFRRDLALSEINRNLGITSLPEAATASAVLQGSNRVFDAGDAEGDFLLNPSLRPAPMTLPVPPPADRRLQGPPQFIEETRNAARTISPTGQALEEVTGLLDYPGTVFDRPTSSLVEAGTTMGPQQAADAAAFAAQQTGANQAQVPVVSGPLPDMVDAETDMVARDLTDPNRPGYSGGLPIGLETYTRPDGVTVTRNLAGLTEEQRANQPFSMDVANFMGSQPYGYELDNQGNVIGQVGTPGMSILGNAVTGLQNMIMGPPETVEDLLDRGVYTGTSLPGSTSDGVGGEQYDARAVDPCPAGYQMRDGVCQPVDDLISPDPPRTPGEDFVINPTTGLPTLFTPATQATQVGQINPFVLQPYAPPVGINPPGQGIQALSPTGAALGRQV